MFAKFPQFTKLQYGHRKAYEEFIKDFPPVHDISFGGLLTWWNPLDNMAIAELNGNLVIPYWLPGSEKHSGLSLAGTNKIDESICQIFDYLREKGDPVRLVNVPEFVVANVAYPDLFTFKHDRFYDEYILPATNFYPLDNMTHYRQSKVKRQLARLGGQNISVRMLDLHKKQNQDLILTSVELWQERAINNFGRYEVDALRDAIQHHMVLGINALGLFVEDRLYGLCVYSRSHDARYINVTHIKATHPTAYSFELIAYLFTKWFAERGVLYGNVGADLGLSRLRMFMLTLGPTNFFRKYTVIPR